MIGRAARWTPGLDRRAVFHPPPAPLTTTDAARVPASERHVVVVGGGIAGLTAAVGLAERGVRVTVLEREARLGGGAALRRAARRLRLDALGAAR